MRALTPARRARTRLAATVAAPAGGRASSWPEAVPMPSIVRARLAATGLPWPASTVWTVALGAVVASVSTLTFVGSPLTGLLLVVVAAVGCWLVTDALGERFRRRAEGQLPEVVDAIVTALRAGASLRQAIAEVAAAAPEPVARRLMPVVRAVERGVPLETAFDEWAEHDRLAGVALVAAALAVAAQVGGGAAEALQGVAATLRERLAIQRELRALGAQARASAAVMVAAPLLFSALAAGIDSGIAAFLFHSSAGALCLATGLTLDLAGGWWMHRLTASQS